MSDQQKIKLPPDQCHGRLIVGLLNTKLSSSAKLCFGVMWSFGSAGCWASTSTIAKRMSMARNTVTKAQDELEKAGWIIQTGKSELGVKSWEMRTCSMVEQVGEYKPAQPLSSPCATIEQVPAQPLGTKQEGKQEKNQEYSDAFSAAYELKYGSKPHPPKSVFVNLASLIKSGITKEDFKNRVGAYFKAEWPPQKDFQGLLTHWDKFASVRAYTQKNPGESGYLPPAMRPRI